MHPQKAFIGQQYVRRFISSLHGESSFAPEEVLGQPEKRDGALRSSMWSAQTDDGYCHTTQFVASSPYYGLVNGEANTYSWVFTEASSAVPLQNRFTETL